MTTEAQKEALKSAREELANVRPEPTYPAMSREGVDAVIEAQVATRTPYISFLNCDDFRMLMNRLVWVTGNDEQDEWAASFASSIAESLGVEWV